MSQAEEYQTRYTQIDKYCDPRLEDVIRSLSFLVEDMIDTIRELEEYCYPGGLTENLEVGSVELVMTDKLRDALIKAGVKLSQ